MRANSLEQPEKGCGQLHLDSGESLALCQQAVTVAGKRLTPDRTKAYLTGTLSHAFPVVTAHGTALDARTVQNSYKSMEHQIFNKEHRMVTYGTAAEDEHFGTIVEVELINETKADLTDAESTLGIRMAAVLHKQVACMAGVLENWNRGTDAKPTYALSMEMNYTFKSNGYVIYGKPKVEMPAWVLATTPPDFAAAGLGYVPWTEVFNFNADGEPSPNGKANDLAQCYSLKEHRVTQGWQGRKVVVLCGGINGTVRYFGAALVKRGAEPTAGVEEMLARKPEDPKLVAGLRRLREALKV